MNWEQLYNSSLWQLEQLCCQLALTFHFVFALRFEDEATKLQQIFLLVFVLYDDCQGLEFFCLELEITEFQLIVLNNLSLPECLN